MSVHIVIQGTSGCATRFLPAYNRPSIIFNLDWLRLMMSDSPLHDADRGAGELDSA